MVRDTPHATHPQEGGVALADAMCAFAVLAAVVTFAFAGHSNHLRHAVEAMDHTRGRYLAFSLIEAARARAAVGALEQGVFTADPTEWFLPVASQPKATWEVQAHPEHSALLQVRAVVRWSTPATGQEHTVTDEALVCAPEGHR